MKRWYAVNTHPQGEERAQGHLERQGFTVYLPRYAKRRCHARRVDWVTAPLFPRYLFVCLDVAATRWRAVNSTFAVSHIVCHGDQPAPVPDGVIDDIRRREGEDGLVALGAGQEFRPGEEVRIVEGAFSDQVGLFQCATDRDRVIVLLDLLGRQIKARLPRRSIFAAA